MTTNEKQLTGKKVLAWFIGFFLVVFTANGIMAYFALNTWTGLETENSYVKGLNYNNEIENARTQEQSGWDINISTKPEMTEGRFEITLSRPEDSLPPADVSAHFIRAVVEGHDQEIKLTHTGNGIYGATVKLPLSGQWNVLIVVKSQNNLIFKQKDWLVVK